MDLINSLKKLYVGIRLDRSIVFTILTRLIQSIGTVITLLLVTSQLSPNEQGYFYTFSSILAIQVFLDFGLTSIVVQYIAYEAAHLSWSKSELVGDVFHRSRLASIVQLSIKWVLVLSVVLFIVLFIAGKLFFSRFNAELSIQWQVPWLLLSIGTCFLLLINLFIAIVEGLGKVKEAARIRLFQQLINSISIALLLAAGLKLFSAGLALLITSTFLFLFLFTSDYWKTFKMLWHLPVTSRISYKKEIFPFQYKIGLGNISSLLIYQLFSPVLFATQGAVLAGQMGATQTCLNGIFAISLSWFSTKTVLFSNLVSTQKFKELNAYYRTTLFVAFMICLAGILLFVALVVMLKTYYPIYGNRFLPLFPLILFSLAQLTSTIGNAQAYYLRSFKQDPFFIPSILMGLFSGIATVVISKHYSITEMSMAYFGINAIIGFLWGCVIFRNKSYQWTNHKHSF